MTSVAVARPQRQTGAIRGVAATIQITLEILGLVAGIYEFKGAWRALGTLAPDRLSALLRVATIEMRGV